MIILLWLVCERASLRYIQNAFKINVTISAYECYAFFFDQTSSIQSACGTQAKRTFSFCQTLSPPSGFSVTGGFFFDSNAYHKPPPMQIARPNN